MKKILTLFCLLIVTQLFSQEIKDTLKGVEIVSFQPYKATEITPITFQDIKQKYLTYRNFGQEPSSILNSISPSISSYSDCGGNWGYSYFRLRGIDQTRINVTLNGVPMNEPEDQGFYFSNFTDFLKSVKTMQIQRGTGMTKNGISSVGGSINLETTDVENKGFMFNMGSGSFNSMLLSVEFRAKLKKNSILFRNSYLETEGYKNHSGNISRSYYLSDKYQINKKNTIKFVGIVGNQKNQLAWLGSPLDSINVNPRHNSNTENEKDDFTQSHFQLHHSYTINNFSSLNSCVYFNHLKGWYIYDYQDTITFGDKYNLKSLWGGFNTNYFRKKRNFSFYTGINTFTYKRNHTGENSTDYIQWNKAYENTGYKNEATFYIKGIYNIYKFNIFGDIQYRHTEFDYKGDVSFKKMKWDFINPTIGLSYIKNRYTFYYNIGKTSHEPTRNDLFRGYDNLYVMDTLKSEILLDQELGLRYLKDKKFMFNVNLYNMKFKNEITLTGDYGYTGLALKKNSDNSFRSGIEVESKLCLEPIDFVNTSSFSYNKAGDNIQVLTPSIIVNQDVFYNVGIFTFCLTGRYQGSSYIDVNNKYKLPDYFIMNFSIRAKLDNVECNLFLNNLTDKKHLISGMMDYTGNPSYFIHQPFNWFINLRIFI